MNAPERKKAKKIIELLKFVLTLDDMELMKSSLEQVVEMLEDQVQTK
jgi:hypothetical protein